MKIIIKVFNEKGESLDRVFTSHEEADKCELLLSFAGVKYEYYLNGEKIPNLRTDILLAVE